METRLLIATVITRCKYIYIYIYSLRHSIKRIKHQRCLLTDMKEKKNVKIKKKKKKQEWNYKEKKKQNHEIPYLFVSIEGRDLNIWQDKKILLYQLFKIRELGGEEESNSFVKISQKDDFDMNY